MTIVRKRIGVTIIRIAAVFMAIGCAIAGLNLETTWSEKP